MKVSLFECISATIKSSAPAMNTLQPTALFLTIFTAVVSCLLHSCEKNSCIAECYWSYVESNRMKVMYQSSSSKICAERGISM